ncbi:MAG: hypothetical protein AWT59_3251 [Candidatus Gallionella acididurans]|uniref:SHOCT domain-containing protein n=1 Tax=Candidatus Gallionella acididurans TaxID=1796491 RepID=A0A139BNP6_9PROT|nr:MAG: hypothetical protein AWT59_3251 [Candidatus Gallionella acididurans]
MAMYGSGSDSGSWMHGSGMFSGGLVMILMWLIPILLVVALIAFLTKRPGFGPNKKTKKTSLDISKESTSRGEIGKDKFDQRKRDIGS